MAASSQQPSVTDVTESSQQPSVTDVTESSQQPSVTDVTESSQQPSVTDVTESSQQTGGDKSLAQPAAAEESNVVMVSKKAHWRRSPKLDRLVGRGKVEVNMGEEGLNDANTVVGNYNKAPDLRKELQVVYEGEWASRSNKRGTEYDHPSGKVEHANRMYSSDDSISYGRSPAIATPPAQHLAKGNARLAEPGQKLNYVFEEDGSPSVLALSNNTTILQQSHAREKLDIDVVKGMDIKEFDIFGIKKETTISSIEHAHALDRQDMESNRQKLGLRNHIEQYDLSVLVNINKSATACVEELYTVCQDATPDQIRNPEFVKIIYNAFYGLWNGKKFNEGIRSNYHHLSKVSQHMIFSESIYKEQLSPLLRLLEDKGLELSKLYTYNKDLTERALVCINFEAETLLFGKAVIPGHVVSRENLDFLAAQLNANSTCKGRHRLLPKANIMYNALTVSSEVVSSLETLEQSDVVNLSEGRANSAPSETLPITPASSSETLTTTPVSEGATSESTRQGVRPLQSSSTISRQDDIRSLSRRQNSSKVDNNKALVVYRPPVDNSKALVVYRPPVDNNPPVDNSKALVVYRPPINYRPPN